MVLMSNSEKPIKYIDSGANISVTFVMVVQFRADCVKKKKTIKKPLRYCTFDATLKLE